MPPRSKDGLTDRRRVLVAAGLSVAALFASRVAAAGQTVYVFAVNDRRAHAVEQDLSQALSGAAVTVFGRIADFIDGVQKNNPEVILAPELVLKELNIPPVLRGTLGGETTEQFSVLTDKTRSAQNATSFGAVDLLGRRGMPGLVQKLMGRSTAPKVVRVAKVEDLLPVLTFNSAEAVILPSRLVGSLRARTSMELSITQPESARLGCLCAGGRGATSMVSALRSAPRDALSQLGVDGWR